MTRHSHIDDSGQRAGLSGEAYAEGVREYLHFHSEQAGGDVEARKSQYQKMVNHYYDLATDFYQWGWGDSFHFARRYRGEGFRASIKRHQHHLADRVGIHPGMRVLDVGCGVGGPMRSIARHTGATIVGINNNAYQIRKGETLNARAGLSHRCNFVKGDFMDIPCASETFDAMYSIEATCHAPEREGLFAELYRVLKPGAVFGSYEWCLTRRHDLGNREHQRIKKGIEEGNGLPDLVTIESAHRAAEAAGFETVDVRDLADECDPETPWYLPLTDDDHWTNFLRSPRGRRVTHGLTAVLERLKIAPKGSLEVSDFLQNAADALVAGGRAGTFTPMALLLVRKPS